MTLPTTFLTKKRKILVQLSVSDAEYDDLSPKGSIDVGIRELIDEINAAEGWVTTSSCGGRVSVFLEGRREEDNDGEWKEDGEAEDRKTTAKIGGKGGGGHWLFVSHDPVDPTVPSSSLAEKLGMSSLTASSPGMSSSRRLIHFKFEPMVLFLLYTTISLTLQINTNNPDRSYIF
jgi:tRNA wybutosine-synthesizing protein 3